MPTAARGGPKATYLLERLVALRLGAGPLAGRDPQAQLHPRVAVPDASGPAQYDIGDYEACMTRAQELAEVGGFAARKAESEREGQAARHRLLELHRGLRAGAVEHRGRAGCAGRPVRGGRGARASDRRCDGVHRFAQPWPNPTRPPSRRWWRPTWASRSRTSTSCTATPGRIPFGMGTYGSRSISVGGAAIMRALDKIEAKAKKIAAHLMEASDADIEFAGGEFTVKGTDKKIPFGQVALGLRPAQLPARQAGAGPERDGLLRLRPTSPTPRAPTSARSRSTRARAKSRSTASTVGDFGTIINPMIVEGQVHGGIVQGIGQALMENCVYDNETGQLLTGSFMDYAITARRGLPQLQARHRVHALHPQSAGHQGLRRGGAPLARRRPSSMPCSMHWRRWA